MLRFIGLSIGLAIEQWIRNLGQNSKKIMSIGGYRAATGNHGWRLKWNQESNKLPDSLKNNKLLHTIVSSEKWYSIQLLSGFIIFL